MAEEVRIAVHPEYSAAVQADEEKVQELVRCATSFTHFLRYWKFLDQETGVQRILGEELWDGQEQLVEAMENVPKLFAFKARKLGFTTLEEAYDGWVARFRDKNARVHLFSRRDDAARELLEAVKYGLDRLPEWMKLPYAKAPTTLELRLRGEDEDDTRIVKSYPTSEETAVEATCTHGHVDEWARMRNPRLVWQAIEPSMAGSCHIITTGRGPVNFSSVFWRQCMAGDTDFVPIFVDALARPDRDWEWLEQKRKGASRQHVAQEYPMRWEDAMIGDGDLMFSSVDVDKAGDGFGPSPPEKDHRYIKSWDIGRHKDAAVGTVFDASEDPTQVVEYVRLRGVPYPHLQEQIQRIHHLYPGKTVIEKNAAGEAVAENLVGIPDHELILFNTSAKSKARILEELRVALEQHHLKWDALSWPQLDSEVRGYMIPDDHIVQDSVMSLAIGNAHLSQAFSVGKVGKVLEW